MFCIRARLSRAVKNGANEGFSRWIKALLSLALHFQKPLQPEDVKSIACGNLRPALLRLDPALGTRVEEIEGQHTAVQHLVMECPYVEL